MKWLFVYRTWFPDIRTWLRFSNIIEKKRFIYFHRWYNIDYKGCSKRPVKNGCIK